LQRIPRYTLLLRELIGNMDEDHMDYDKIIKANTDIKDVATRVNERLREQNAQERLVTLSEQNVIEGLTFELLRASRKFLHEGVLGYVTHAGIKHRTIFLFSDLLLSAIPITPAPENNGTVENTDSPNVLLATERYRMKSAISFLSNPLVWVNNLDDGFVLENAFQIVTEFKVWTFFARNAEEKKEWVTKINKSIELLKHVPTLQNATNSPMYAPQANSKICTYLSPKALAAMLPHDQNPKPSRSPAPTENTLRANSPTHKKKDSFSKLINKFSQKQKKKVELNQLNGTIDSDDEEEETEVTLPVTPLKPWMDECNQRLVEKQRHLQLVNVLFKEEKEVAPLMKELVGEDYEVIAQSPLYGLRGASTQQMGVLRVSMEIELKEKYKEAEADFNSFISAFKGNISSATTSGVTDSTQQKRKSRFFFL
jgi:hypothetical protein